MASGRHIIKIDSEEMDTIEQEIELTEYEVKDIEIEGEPAKRWVRITTQPPGANIYINGKEQESITPIQIKVEIGKEYEIEAIKEGYAKETKKMNISEKGKLTFFNIELNKAPYPEKPRITYPENNEKEITPGEITLRWEGNKEENITYRIEIEGKEHTTNNTYYTIKATERGKEYSWRVTAINEYGNETTSDTYYFTTKEIPEGMVLVEGGTFQMGDTWGDGYSDERPVHEVTLTYDFYIGKYEITNEEYVEFLNDKGINENGSYNGKELIDMDDSDCQIKHDGSNFYITSDLRNNPVIEVSWWGGIYYCNWLSEEEGLSKAYNNDGKLLNKWGNETTDITEVEGYRLPTEAEWEFAARGGNESNGYKYAGSNDPDEVAWYYYNSGNHTHEVGTKEPNELGIYDMSGNVWEWCQDWYDYDYYEISPETNPYNHEAGSSRVLRGGSWDNVANNVRVAYRYSNNPGSTRNFYGFRICRTVY